MTLAPYFDIYPSFSDPFSPFYREAQELSTIWILSSYFDINTIIRTIIPPFHSTPFLEIYRNSCNFHLPSAAAGAMMDGNDPRKTQKEAAMSIQYLPHLDPMVEMNFTLERCFGQSPDTRYC